MIVIIVTTNSKNNQSLNNHKQLKHKGITYDCNQCEYKATTMGSLKVLKQSQHERFEYICVEFEYGAKQTLNIYKQSKHEASFVVINVITNNQGSAESAQTIEIYGDQI